MKVVIGKKVALMFESQTVVWSKKKCSRFTDVQIDNIRDLMEIRVDKILNAWIG